MSTMGLLAYVQAQQNTDILKGLDSAVYRSKSATILTKSATINNLTGQAYKDTDDGLKLVTYPTSRSSGSLTTDQSKIYCTSVAFNGELLFIGGARQRDEGSTSSLMCQAWAINKFDASGVHSVVDVPMIQNYSAGTGTLYRSNPGCAVLSGELYVIGSGNSNTSLHNIVKTSNLVDWTLVSDNLPASAYSDMMDSGVYELSGALYFVQWDKTVYKSTNGSTWTSLGVVIPGIDTPEHENMVVVDDWVYYYDYEVNPGKLYKSQDFVTWEEVAGFEEANSYGQKIYNGSMFIAGEGSRNDSPTYYLSYSLDGIKRHEAPTTSPIGGSTSYVGYGYNAHGLHPTTGRWYVFGGYKLNTSNNEYSNGRTYYHFDMSVPLTGSGEVDIPAKDELATWQDVILTHTIPAGTKVYATILDMSDTVLIAKSELATIDISSLTVDEFKLNLELERTSTGQESPSADTIEYIKKSPAFDAYASMQYQTSMYASGVHQANTHLDIVGSGYLVVVNDHTGETWSLQIDGGPIYEFTGAAEGLGMPFFPVGFNTSLIVKSSTYNASSSNVWAVLE